MEPSEYGAVFAAEESHWWYAGMRAITEHLLQRFYPESGNLRILDAGCGTGGSMVYLAGYGEVLGCDYSPNALAYCRIRQLPYLSRASVEGLPYAENSFDLVTSFDVLYHQAVEDYHGALGQFYRVLKPGGRLFLRLPAYNWLRGHHDEVIATSRRFTTGELRDALVDVNFVVEQLSYANCFLFPLALAKRISERVFRLDADTSDVYPITPWQNQIFASVLKAEAKWLREGKTLPFGLTVVAIGKKL